MATRAAAGALAALVVPVALAGCGGGSDPAPRAGGPTDIVLATTTEVRDSGLLASLLPGFTSASGCSVTTEARTATKALALGAAGRADALLVDVPAAEKRYLAAGTGSFRVAVMRDGFLLVGPQDDPAGAGKAGDPVGALAAIATDKSAFRSRGDRSGTAVLERSLWKAAAVRPTKPWYVETHAVMPPTLLRASTDQAYALTDRATFLRLQKQLKLRVIAQGGDRLADPYSVIVVAHPDARPACARKLADYLDSPGSQAIINSFGVTQWGQPLYAGAAPTP